MVASGAGHGHDGPERRAGGQGEGPPASGACPLEGQDGETLPPLSDSQDSPIPSAASAHGAWGGTRPTAGARRRPPPRKAEALEPPPGGRPGEHLQPGLGVGESKEGNGSFHLLGPGWKAKRVSESGPTPKISDRKMEYTRGPEKPKPLRAYQSEPSHEGPELGCRLHCGVEPGSGLRASRRAGGTLRLPDQGRRDRPPGGLPGRCAGMGGERPVGAHPSEWGSPFPSFGSSGDTWASVNIASVCDEDVCQEGKDGSPPGSTWLSGSSWATKNPTVDTGWNSHASDRGVGSAGGQGSRGSRPVRGRGIRGRGGDPGQSRRADELEPWSTLWLGGGPLPLSRTHDDSPLPGARPWTGGRLLTFDSDHPPSPTPAGFSSTG